MNPSESIVPILPAILFSIGSSLGIHAPKPTLNIGAQQRLLIEATLPAGTTQFNLTLPTELMAEPLVDLNLRTRHPNCLQSMHRLFEPKTASRTQRPYRIKIRPECHNMPLQIEYESQSPRIATTYDLLLETPSRRHKFPIQVQGGPAVALNCIQRGGMLQCTSLDAYGNLATDRIQMQTESGNHKFTGQFQKPLPQWHNPRAPYPYTFQKQQFYAAAQPSAQRPVWFGDLHSHTLHSDARVPVTARKTLQYAKSVSLLDFTAITDHTEGIFSTALTTGDRQTILQATEAERESGSFGVLYGYEWTSTFFNPNSPYGHRVVLTPDNSTPWYSSNTTKANSLEKLYALCQDCIYIPHHSMMPWGAFRFDRPWRRKQEPILEIFSTHGRFEYPQTGHGILSLIPQGSLRAALKKGWMPRVIAGSDSHLGHPGLNDWRSPDARARVQPLELDGGGLVAVFSPSPNASDVFAALKQGRAYATSGTRILLEPHSHKNPFPLRVTGTAPLKKVVVNELHSNREWYEQTLFHVRNHDRAPLHTRMDPKISSSTRLYYLRIEQMDGEMAWIGPYKRD